MAAAAVTAPSSVSSLSSSTAAATAATTTIGEERREKTNVSTQVRARRRASPPTGPGRDDGGSPRVNHDDERLERVSRGADVHGRRRHGALLPAHRRDREHGRGLGETDPPQRYGETQRGWERIGRQHSGRNGYVGRRASPLELLR